MKRPDEVIKSNGFNAELMRDSYFGDQACADEFY
jgi:hypothetical protein